MNGEWFWLGVVLLLAAALILPRLFPEPVSEPRAPEPTPLAWNPERRRWTQQIIFAGQVIEVALDGDPSGPSAEAMGTWLDLRGQLDETWQSVIKFTLRETARNGVQLYEPDEFGIKRVDLCPEDPQHGGDVIFAFEVASELGTVFTVPLRHGKPLSLQRSN
ncbi:MAG TPA: hypothetical protein VMZ53_24520 [Kofleriaceae bacterium]|nr:hypothetical protein [Kofleriaceae bacterium]